MPPPLFPGSHIRFHNDTGYFFGKTFSKVVCKASSRISLAIITPSGSNRTFDGIARTPYRAGISESHMSSLGMKVVYWVAL